MRHRTFRGGRELDFPLAADDYRLFMREVADVHRALFPGNEDLYGDNVRGKIERCLAVTDDEVAAAERQRAEYRERAAAALDGVDLLVTPTIGFVAPPADVDELTIRERGIRFTYPFDSLGWPALARSVRAGRGRFSGVDPARRAPRRRFACPGGRTAPRIPHSRDSSGLANAENEG